MSEPEPVRVREKRPETHPPPAALRLAIGGTLLAGRKLAELLADWIELAEEVQATEPADEPVRDLLTCLLATAVEAMGAIFETVRPHLERLLEGAGDGTLESLFEAVTSHWQELPQGDENRTVAALCHALAEAARRRSPRVRERPSVD